MASRILKITSTLRALPKSGVVQVSMNIKQRKQLDQKLEEKIIV